MRYLNFAAAAAPFVLLALLLGSIVYTPSPTTSDAPPRATLLVATPAPATGDLIELNLDPAREISGNEAPPVEPVAVSSGLRMPYFSFERVIHARRGL